MCLLCLAGGGSCRGGIFYLFAQAFPLFFHLRCRNIFFAEFVEIADRLICHFFCFAQDGVGLFIRFAQDPVSLFIQLLLALLGLLFQSLRFTAVSGDLFPLLLDRPAACLQVGEQIFKGYILFTEPFLCIFDNKIGQSQLAGDGECVALSGNTDEQPVSRTETLHVEFAAGILHARRRECIYFQLTVVCGRHCTYISLMQIREDGCGKGSAFRGICTGAQLVKKYKGMFVYFLQERDDICHM